MKTIKFPKLQEARSARDDFSVLVYCGHDEKYRECRTPEWLFNLLQRTEAAGRARGASEVRAAARRVLGL